MFRPLFDHFTNTALMTLTCAGVRATPVAVSIEMVTMVFSSEDVVATDAAKRRRDTAPPREKYTMETSMALAATVVGYVVESAVFSATVAFAISCSSAFLSAVSFATVSNLSALKFRRCNSATISSMATAVGSGGGAGGVLTAMLSTFSIMSSLLKAFPEPSTKPFLGRGLGQLGVVKCFVWLLFIMILDKSPVLPPECSSHGFSFMPTNL
mmetsp:Transcript_12041/g.44760  ORF Transcript_12041/g.44760 Transcript_12041/m.44760 type:complete len:211 (-) Transcript_12041:410-1042(-)